MAKKTKAPTKNIKDKLNQLHGVNLAEYTSYSIGRKCLLDSYSHISVPYSKALYHALSSNGKVLSIPSLYEAIGHAIKSEEDINKIAPETFSVTNATLRGFGNYMVSSSERYVLSDKEGILVKPNCSVYMCLHGTGIFLPYRLYQADHEKQKEGNTYPMENIAFHDEEVKMLLEGKLKKNEMYRMKDEKFKLVHVDNLEEKEIDPFDKTGIWMEYMEAIHSPDKIFSAMTGNKYERILCEKKSQRFKIHASDKLNYINPFRSQGNLLSLKYSRENHFHHTLQTLPSLGSFGKLFVASPKGRDIEDKREK